jgi:hypothetical protein
MRSARIGAPSQLFIPIATHTYHVVMPTRERSEAGGICCRRL